VRARHHIFFSSFTLNRPVKKITSGTKFHALYNISISSFHISTSHRQLMNLTGLEVTFFEFIKMPVMKCCYVFLGKAGFYKQNTHLSLRNILPNDYFFMFVRYEIANLHVGSIVYHIYFPRMPCFEVSCFEYSGNQFTQYGLLFCMPRGGILK